MLTRRDLTTSSAAGLAALTFGSPLLARAQDALEALPEGALRDQVRWFIEMLNATDEPLTDADVEAHFTPAFLQQVPAEQVVASVEGLKPALGTVTVERISSGTTEHEAGVLLVGATGVRVRLSVWLDPDSGLIDGLMIQPDTNAGTPAAVSSPASPAVATEVVAPPTTADILPAYRDASDALMAQGRDLTASFLAGDDAAVTGAFSEAVSGMLAGFSARDTIASLTTDIVSFAIAEVRAFFAGHYTPEEISGQFHQGTPAAFRLEPDDLQTGDVPAGRWTGDIIIGTYTLGIEVTFSGTAEALAATISIPEQGLQDLPLADVRFEAERPLGELLDERALPMGPSVGTSSYGALYAWGDAMLAINSAFDEAGKALALTAVMQVALPEDPANGISEITSVPAAVRWSVAGDLGWGDGVPELPCPDAGPAPRARHRDLA